MLWDKAVRAGWLYSCHPASREVVILPVIGYHVFLFYKDSTMGTMTTPVNSLQKKGLNIGCGNDIRQGYINLDRMSLPGVDVVWDITKFPYPFEDNRFDSILVINVLEHLPDTIKTMEEFHRICKPGATLTIRVPYWNSIEQATDPTHIHFFSERSMDYFDPVKKLCQRRTYYSTSRYTIKSVNVWIMLGNRNFLIRNHYFCSIFLGISHYISNVTHLIEYDLLTLKS